jgi:hypothetical protein
MFELYAQKSRGCKCESMLWVGDDPMQMSFEHKTKMKVDHITKKWEMTSNNLLISPPHMIWSGDFSLPF